MNDICRQHATQHNCRCDTDQTHTSLLKRREETRTDLHTDRVNEQNQTKLLDECDDRWVDLHTETAQCNTHKQDPRNTERDSGDFDFAQRDTDSNRNRQSKYRMGNAITKE